MTDDNHLDFEVNGEIIAVIKRHKANTATMAREIAITARQLDEAQADIEKLRADLEAAKVELLKAQIENNRTYCAYCGTEFLLDDDAAKNVTDHIKTCKKHPMRAVEAELAQAREALRSIAQSDPVVVDGKEWRMERKDAIDRAAAALLELLKEE